MRWGNGGASASQLSCLPVCLPAWPELGHHLTPRTLRLECACRADEGGSDTPSVCFVACFNSCFSSRECPPPPNPALPGSIKKSTWQSLLLAQAAFRLSLLRRRLVSPGASVPLLSLSGSDNESQRSSGRCDGPLNPLLLFLEQNSPRRPRRFREATGELPLRLLSPTLASSSSASLHYKSPG